MQRPTSSTRCQRAFVAAVAASCILAAAIHAESPVLVEGRLREDLKTLSSDDFEGRGVGTQGLELAADHVRRAFEAAGLNVTVAGGDPFQEFDVTTGAKLLEPNTLAVTGPDGQKLDLVYDQDFRTCSFGDAGSFSAGIVFCGYGIESKDPAYDDFAGVDVKGKAVIIVRRTPQQGREGGLFATGHGESRHAALRSKVSHAYQKGAAAILFVNDPWSGRSQAAKLKEQLAAATERVVTAAETFEAASPDGDGYTKAREELTAAVKHLQQVRGLVANDNPDPLMAFGYGGSRSGRAMPILHITQEACNRILQPALGKTLEEVESLIDETGRPHSAVLDGWTAVGQTSLELVRVPVKNVIAVLEGEGPLADETIVVGAHYDHVGLGGEGSLAPGSTEVHNGADDNASGTAALIEVARRLAARDRKLPRRVVFIAFTGEERGLLGSAHYVKDPLFPLDKTIAMVNMDMVGRLLDEKLTVFGTGTSPVWDELLAGPAAQQGLAIVKKPEGFGPSDHSSFYAKQIPVLHLFTGTHSDYHRPSDDWQKINYEGMARIVTLVEDLVVSLAKSEERPAYVSVQGRATMERSGARPYFGSIPDFSSDQDGYAIQGVAPGSPADKAGIKSGDTIVRLGGHAIGSLDDFDLALRKFSAGQEVETIVRRDGQEVKLKVTLAQPRQ
jgi:hypothetical protein